MSARARRTRNSRGLRIARLRARRHRADFDVAESQRAQRVEVVTVLVETRRQAHRMRKAQSQGIHLQAGCVPDGAGQKGCRSLSPSRPSRCALSGGSRSSTGSATRASTAAAEPFAVTAVR